MWIVALDRWLLSSAIFGTVVLLFGSLALLFIKQPVHRIRVIQWTLIACLFVPIFQQFELLPGYSLALWKDSTEVEQFAKPLVANTMPTADAKSSRFASTAFTLNGSNQPNQVGPDAIIPDGFTSDEAHGFNGTVTAETSAISTSSMFQMQLILGIRLLYSLGLILTVSWLILGWSARRRIILGSHLASAPARNILRNIASSKDNRTRLLTSDQIFAPIMWGILRPTIVIPTKLADGRTDLNLKYGLAHEWSHVARGDFLNVALANVTKLVCFYQPAFWWLRKQLTLSQDFLADEFAASHGDQAEDYAAFLVSLARQRRSIESIGVLCMADRQSALLRRVCMLVHRTNPLQQKVGRLSALIMATVTLLSIASLSVIRLSAHATEITFQQPATDKPSAEDKKLPDAITYVGKVLDRETGAPIVGASVEISHQLNRDPKTNRWIELEVTKHETDKTGTYQFTLPPEQVAENSLYIEVTTKHSDYQQKGPEGYAHSMILKNIEIGDPPFYETIKLSRGEPITFRVLQPNGEPASNAKITAYSKPTTSKQPDWEHGSFQHTQTDANGVGRILVSGDGVIWIFPKEHSPVAIRIGKKRGKIDDVILGDGVRLSGRVLNTRGEPVANVAFNVRRKGDGEETDEFLNSNSVANQISSGALTDETGHFTLRPLPPGTYRAQVSSRVEDSAVDRVRWQEELKVIDVFLPMQINIQSDTPNEPIEVRAVPHVIVRGRFFDSKGKPRRSHEQNIFARHNGEGYFASSTTPGTDGWFEFRVPHGIEKAEVDLMTNEHSSLRWRLKPNDPLQQGRRIELGTLEEDVTTLEVVRYTAPIILVKAVDENGTVMSEYKPDSTYNSKSKESMMGRYVNGGDVGFEKQPDNRWRSSQLLPDEEIKISILLEGYETEPQSLSIPEGETRELTFVMKKKG